MEAVTKVYVYTRVSTAMQVDGFSLSAQMTDIKKFTDFKGYEIVGQYCDEGKSGKSVNQRTAFKQMMQDIKDKKDNVRFVVVFKLSRFARNAADTLQNLREMQKYGVDLISVSDNNIDSSSSFGKAMISIMSAFAEMELENIHTQTIAGRKQKAREGKWNGGFAPYGCNLVDGKLVVDEDEAKTIRYIFELFNTTGLGALGIAKKMEAEGVKR